MMRFYMDLLALVNLLVGLFYWRRHMRSKEFDKLEFARKAFRRAQSLMDENTYAPAKRYITGAIGMALYLRSERSNSLEDEEEAITHLRMYLKSSPNGNAHSGLPFLVTFSSALTRRYIRTEEAQVLDELIDALQDLAAQFALETLHQQTETTLHTTRPICFLLLGGALWARFEKQRDITDIEAAIMALQNASRFAPPVDSSLKCAIFFALGRCYLIRFQESPKLEHIDNAIVASRGAVESLRLPEDDTFRPYFLQNLGFVYQKRSAFTKNIQDIDNAITFLQDATRCTPPNHPAYYLNYAELSVALLERSMYHEVGDPIEENQRITKALRIASTSTDTLPADIGFYRRVLGIVSDNIPMDNPVGTPKESSEIKDVVIDLLHLHRRSERFQENGVSWAASFADLSIMLLGKIQLVDSSEIPSHLGHLSQRLVHTFTHTRDLGDLTSAIYNAASFIDDLPRGISHSTLHLLRLSHALYQGFEEVSKSSKEHAAEIYKLRVLVTLLAAYNEYGAPMHCLTAFSWISPVLVKAIGSTEDLETALTVHSDALKLVPGVVWLGQPFSGRFHDLESTGVVGLVVSNAVTIAIAARRYDRALEWLEVGRGIVWGQLLRLRLAVDNLRAKQPALADEIVDVSLQIDTFDSPSTSQTLQVDVERDLADDSDSDLKRRELANKYNSLLQQARELPGFSSFLDSQTLPDLHVATKHGPVIIINVHSLRSDALVLSPCGDIVHVPLPGLNLKRVQDLQSAFARVLSSADLRSRGSRTTKKQNVRTEILRPLWLYVVDPILKAMNNELDRISKFEDRLPHVTWCTTGPLAFLPLHAAGIYDPGQASLSTSNFVVSSYTPSISALSQAHSRPRPPTEARSVLIVSQPNTPGQPPLPGTEDEVAAVRRHFPQNVTALFKGAEARVDSVLDALPRHTIVHLACHGIQNGTQSAFALHDGRLTLDTLAVGRINAHADLAVLSACQTATGDAKMPEEAVHLTAGMLVSGYRSVVGTMWSIGDSDAPQVMDAFYGELLKLEASELRDSSAVAYALHHAVGELRKSLGDDEFMRWAPFVHYGV